MARGRSAKAKAPEPAGVWTSNERRALADLRPYERNAKLHPADQIDLIVRSIAEFGLTVPILIDETGMILAGHARAEALARPELAAEFAEVDVRVIHGLDDAQKRAYILLDNRSTEMGEWDKDLLKLEIGALADLSFDLDLTGFTANDLKVMFPTAPEGFPEVGANLKTEHECPRCHFRWSGTAGDVEPETAAKGPPAS